MKQYLLLFPLMAIAILVLPSLSLAQLTYSQEGEMCGGIAGRLCASGLQCVVPPEMRGQPDSSGVCTRPDNNQDRKEGQTCGGTPSAGSCAPGLYCAYSPWTRTTPEGYGYCTKYGQQGDICGGISGRLCASGLECVVPVKGLPDSSGTCKVPEENSCKIVTKDLSLGMSDSDGETGQEIAALQDFLVKYRFASTDRIARDGAGKFGINTFFGVSKFQRLLRLRPTGRVDSATRDKINEFNCNKILGKREKMIVDGPKILKPYQIGSWTISATPATSSKGKFEYAVFWGDNSKGDPVHIVCTMEIPGGNCRLPKLDWKKSPVFRHFYKKVGTFNALFFARTSKEDISQLNFPICVGTSESCGTVSPTPPRPTPPEPGNRQKGQTCGGTPSAGSCAPGLYCKYPSGTGTTAEGYGVCDDIQSSIIISSSTIPTTLLMGSSTTISWVDNAAPDNTRSYKIKVRTADGLDVGEIGATTSKSFYWNNVGRKSDGSYLTTGNYSFVVCTGGTGFGVALRCSAPSTPFLLTEKREI